MTAEERTQTAVCLILAEEGCCKVGGAIRGILLFCDCWVDDDDVVVEETLLFAAVDFGWWLSCRVTRRTTNPSK
jgi:hypothetical protein